MRGRIRQLDGLRGLAVLGVMWFHWAPPEWRGPVPFEAGLFFFFIVSGYFVTGMMLREVAGEKAGRADGGRWETYRKFLARRFLRILVPYFAALALAAALGAGDVRQAAGWYLLPVCNVHMALTGAEPAEITHFWTLAIQQQFYLLWPLLVLFTPRRALAPVISVLVLAAPAWRLLGGTLLPTVPDPGLLGPSMLDYLGCGSLLAMIRLRRPEGKLPGLAPLAWISFAAYAVCYIAWHSGRTFPAPWWALQQTFFAVACCGLVDAAGRGIRGPVGRILEHPLLLRIGALSYSLYLLHNLAPLLAGHIVAFLWAPMLDSPLGAGLRIFVFAVFCWGLAVVSWRWIEQPVERLRRRIAERESE